MDVVARQHLIQGVLHAGRGKLHAADVVACEAELYRATGAAGGDTREYLARMGDALVAAKYERSESELHGFLRPPWPAWKLFVDLRLFYRNAVALTGALATRTQLADTDQVELILKRQWFELAVAQAPEGLAAALDLIVAQVRGVSPPHDAGWALAYSFAGTSLLETFAFRGLFLWQRLCPATWRRTWRSLLKGAYCWQQPVSLEQEDALIHAEKTAFAASPTFGAYSEALALARSAAAASLWPLVSAASEEEAPLSV
jgi:hypothetical protein